MTHELSGKVALLSAGGCPLLIATVARAVAGVPFGKCPLDGPIIESPVTWVPKVTVSTAWDDIESLLSERCATRTKIATPAARAGSLFMFDKATIEAQNPTARYLGHFTAPNVCVV
jgi:hypothetical protein